MTQAPKPKTLNQLSPNDSDIEILKDQSHFLRGTLQESLADQLTGAISENDTQIIKYHGSYQQDDRDIRNERLARKLEPAYSFMIRVRLPGGYMTAKQWENCDNISRQYGNGTLKLSTRQAIQFHGIIKSDLKTTIQTMDAALHDSIATCGDINRNVMCTQDPTLKPIQRQVYPYAQAISEAFLPQTRAYHEIWLNDDQDKKLLAAGGEIVEPIYGKHYLPRKFKIAIAVPPYNDADVFTNDIGLIAIEKDGKLEGFNVSVGGGLAMTFGRKDTFPRLANLVGFTPAENVLTVIEHIMCIQRDFGNREERKLSRFKYTVEKYGEDWFKKELNDRLGYTLASTQPFEFTTTADTYGWQKCQDGLWHLLLHIEGGRIQNTSELAQKDMLLEISKLDACEFRLTSNQNLQLIDISENNKAKIVAILEKYNQKVESSALNGLQRNAIACVALNTCSLAMAESERYLPKLIAKLQPILAQYNLADKDIKIRMTGCPNGCGRSVMGEIGLIGKSLGKYNLYLGGDFQGQRLAKLFKENCDEATIIETLDPLFAQYSKEGEANEHFGDFLIRAQIIQPAQGGLAFHS